MGKLLLIALIVPMLAACGLFSEPLSPQISVREVYAGYSCQQLAAETQRLANLLSIPVPQTPATSTINNTAVAVVVVPPAASSRSAQDNSIPQQAFNGPSTTDSYLSGYQQGMDIRRQREADERLRAHDRLVTDYGRVQQESISRGCGISQPLK